MSNKILSIGIAAATLLLIPNVVRANQVIHQNGSTGATAAGNNSFAASSVHQSAAQSQEANPNAYVNELGQVVIQEGHGNATALGENSAAVTNINQQSIQNLQGNYSDPNSQQAAQSATANSTALGTNSLSISNTGQYSLQNQWSY